MNLQQSARTVMHNWHARTGGAERVVRELLEGADIEINGSRPHDIKVNNPGFYARVLADSTLGLGESYMDGWWDSERVDETLVRMIGAHLNRKVMQNWRMIAQVAMSKALNMQSTTRAFEVGERHYDIGNDLYTAMLDRRMLYTCGYWKDADTLEQAQENKLDLVCRKIGIRPGMKILELGCGWGSFARFAAERYGAHVTGHTVSKEQVALGRELCAGLPVELKLQDYREASGSYDAVVSIGLMEHIGYKNYRGYMEVVDRCLKPDGIAFVHTIGGNRSRKLVDPWFHKYIFPNALVPSLAQISAATEELLSIEDVHNFGPYYDQTLMAWHERFEAAWPELSKSSRYDERFYRMWRYYLLSCAAGFRGRFTQLYQLVLTRIGTPQPDCRVS